jgi:hypothetical protein
LEQVHYQLTQLSVFSRKSYLFSEYPPLIYDRKYLGLPYNPTAKLGGLFSTCGAMKIATDFQEVIGWRKQEYNSTIESKWEDGLLFLLSTEVIH